MPIEVADTLRQTGRAGSVSSSSYFPIVESQDINFAIEKIVTAGSTVTNQVGLKYIIGENSILSVNGASLNDIVRYTGAVANSGWEVFLDVSNSETNYGLVFNRETKEFIQYNPVQDKWNDVLISGSINGGTFG
jgi:hypothetical protein